MFKDKKGIYYYFTSEKTIDLMEERTLLDIEFTIYILMDF